MGVDVKGNSSLSWHTGLDLKGLKTGVAGAKGILAGFAQNVSAMDIFAGVGIGGVLAFNKLRTATTEFAQEFEHKMKEVQTISDSVKESFNAISDEIMELSTTVPDSAIKLSEALYQIVSAGYDGAKAMDILETSSRLAVATVTDTKTAADAITSVMNAYGKKAGSAAQISDKFAMTIKNAKTTMEELGPQITMVTGLAAQAGMSFDDLMATISQGAKTLKTPQMMTGIRGIITAIISPSKEATEVMEELNLQFDSAALKTKGLSGMLTDMMNTTDGNIETLSKLFPNVRGLAGLLSILTDRGEKWKEQLNNIQNATGSTDEWFNIMMNDTENLGKVFGNLLTKKAKPLGDFFLNIKNNVLKSLNAELSKTGNAFRDFAAESQRTLGIMNEHRNLIAGLVETVETLGDKEKLTREEALKLNSAHDSLKVLMPEYAAAVDEGVGALERMEIAQRAVKELDEEIMEQKLEILKFKQQGIELDLKAMEIEEETNKTKLDKLESEKNRRLKVIEDYANSIINYRDKISKTGEDPFSFLAQTPDETYDRHSAYEPASRRGYPTRTRQDNLIGIQKDLRLTKDEMMGLISEGKSLDDIIDALTKEDLKYKKVQLEVNKAIHERNAKESQLQLELQKTKKQIEATNNALNVPSTPNKPETPTAPAKTATPTVSSEFAGELEKWIIDNRSVEERISDIHARYAKLRDAAHSVELKKRLSLDEQYQVKKIKLEERQKDLTLDINRETLLKYQDYLKEQLRDVEGNDKAEEMITLELNNVKKKLAQQARIDKRESMEGILQDTESLNLKELEAYKRLLKEKIKLYAADSAERALLISELEEVIDKIFARQRDAIKQVAKGVQAVGTVAGVIDDDFGRAFDKVADIVDEVGNLKTALKKALSGDALMAVANIVASFFDLLAGKTEDAYTQAEKLESLISRQENIVNRSRGIQRISEMEKQLQNLKKLQEAYAKAVDKYTKKLKEYYETYGDNLRLSKVEEWLDEALEKMSEVEDRMADIADSISEAITGTNIDELADQLVSAFEDGKTAAKDFADMFEDIMKNAFINIFKQQMLVGELQKWFDMLTNYMKIKTGDYDLPFGIDKDEFLKKYWDALKSQWEKVQTGAKEKWDEMKRMAEELGLDLGFDEPGQQSLTGAIQNIREETADILAGQLGGIRYDVAESKLNIRSMSSNLIDVKSYMFISMNHLDSINKNVANINTKVINIEKNTKSLEQIERHLR